MITQINPNQISGYLRPDQGASAPEAYLHTQITGSAVDAPEIANRPNIRVFRNGVLQTEGELYDYVRQPDTAEGADSVVSSSGSVLYFRRPLSAEERLTVEIYSDTAAPKPLTAGSGINISENGEISVRTDGITAAIDSQNRVCVSGVPQDVLPGFATYDSAGLVRPDYDTCIISNGLLIVKGGGSGGSGGGGGSSVIHYIGGNGISILGNVIRAKTDNETIGFGGGGVLSAMYSGTSGISVSRGVISASVDNSTIKISGGQIHGGYVGSGGVAVSRNVISAVVDNETIKVSDGKLVAVGGSGGSSVAYKAGDGIAIASSGLSSGTISVRADESTISVSGGVLSGVYEGGSGIQINGGMVTALVDGVTVGFDSNGALSAAGSGGIVSVGPGLVLNDGIVSAAPDEVTIGINESGELGGMYSGTSGVVVSGGEISVLTDGVTLVPGENGVLSGGYLGTSGVAVNGAVVSAKYDDRTVGVNDNGELYVKGVYDKIIYAGKGLSLVSSGGSSIINVNSTVLAGITQKVVYPNGISTHVYMDSNYGGLTAESWYGSAYASGSIGKLEANKLKAEVEFSDGKNKTSRVTAATFISVCEEDSSGNSYEELQTPVSAKRTYLDIAASGGYGGQNIYEETLYDAKRITANGSYSAQFSTGIDVVSGNGPYFYMGIGDSETRAIDEEVVKLGSRYRVRRNSSNVNTERITAESVEEIIEVEGGNRSLTVNKSVPSDGVTAYDMDLTGPGRKTHIGATDDTTSQSVSLGSNVSATNVIGNANVGGYNGLASVTNVTNGGYTNNDANFGSGNVRVVNDPNGNSLSAVTGAPGIIINAVGNVSGSVQSGYCMFNPTGFVMACGNDRMTIGSNGFTVSAGGHEYKINQSGHYFDGQKVWPLDSSSYSDSSTSPLNL